jgi:hypothetical protein
MIIPEASFLKDSKVFLSNLQNCKRELRQKDKVQPIASPQK